MPDLVPIRRALISVSDKSGLEPLVRALAGSGTEIISTGGTAKFIESLGVAVTLVEKLTGFPEMMDGRIKTLHPRVHGGILAVRDIPGHAASMREHGISAIDLVCVNLYPFEQTVSAPGVKDAEAIENIDIGGPALIRSAAKNHAFVTIVTDSHQYGRLIAELERTGGATSMVLRRDFARAAYARTAQYDTAIAAYFGRGANEGRDQPSPAVELPEVFRLAFPKAQELRYGENPHQRAALYRDPGFKAAPGMHSVVGARQLHGKELSYNNLNDAAAALAIADDLAGLDASWASAVVVKHANPCGAAVGAGALAAVEAALAGDAVAAYGGILACSAVIDLAAAERLCDEKAFLEVILAPSFASAALEKLKSRWANVRLLVTSGNGDEAKAGEKSPAVDDRTQGQGRAGFAVRSIPGGLLVQDRDSALAETSGWEHRAGPVVSAERLQDAAAVWTVVKHLSSNAVVIGGAASGGGVMMFGAGAGQMDRVTSCRLACEKAGRRAKEAANGSIAASDAFFPFPDGPELLINAGVTMIVHAGGSKRDHETFDLCERRGVACYTTGVRHFRH